MRQTGLLHLCCRSFAVAAAADASPSDAAVAVQTQSYANRSLIAFGVVVVVDDAAAAVVHGMLEEDSIPRETFLNNHHWS